MGRHSDEKGSWFKLWSKRWLKNEMLIQLGDQGEAAFLRVLCAANEYRDDGRFTMRGLGTVVKEQILEVSRISNEQFNSLLKAGLVSQKDGVYYITNWEKWQFDGRKR